MKAELKLQKLNMELAIGYLTIINLCDLQIAKNIEVDKNKEERKKAIQKYANVMGDLVKDVLQLFNINLENLAA
jgi:hypothetical protein